MSAVHGQTPGVPRRSRLLVGISMVALLAVGCGGSSSPSAQLGSDRALSGTLTVLAATSLRGAFTEVVAAFEAQHDAVQVEVSFDGSSGLAAALVEGAPADVFASADQASVETLVDAGLAAGSGTVIATNRLVIVVAKGNPFGIRRLADLADPALVVSLCADGVPCGTYARRAFARAGVDVPPTGGEANVAGVLSRVRLGEADAGVVYVTDGRGAPDLTSVELADDEQVVSSYPAVVLDHALRPASARAFVAFLTGVEGQRILAARGFGPP